MDPDRVVLLEPSGRKHLVVLDRENVKVPGVGVVRAETLRSAIGRPWTVGSRSFLVLTFSMRDAVETLTRGAQIIGPKDLPALIWNCDVKPGDFVVEVGAGSGAVTVALANAVGTTGRVVSYDVRQDFISLARENVKAAGLESRVEFRLGDARATIAERNADAVVVDIPDAWDAVGMAGEALRPSGHFASYCPNVEQVSRTVKALRDGPFVEVRTLEIIEREIVAGEAGTHPSFARLGHTGYLTFGRKVLAAFPSPSRVRPKGATGLAE